MKDALFNFCNAVLLWSKKQGGSQASIVLANLATDLFDIIFPGEAYGACTWDKLDDVYKQAWIGEIIRRFKSIGGATALIKAQAELEDSITALIKAIQKAALASSTVDQVYFSQFCINYHFQGNYVGQPTWLSDKDIKACAKELAVKPGLSITMRTKLYYRGGKWMTLNNRGFALHSLAGVTPVRFVFVTQLSSEETKRLADKSDLYDLNFGNAKPASRRKNDEWESTIPTSVVAVTTESPFRKVVTKGTAEMVAKRVDVLYTVKAQVTGVDLGNQTVLNS